MLFRKNVLGHNFDIFWHILKRAARQINRHGAGNVPRVKTRVKTAPSIFLLVPTFAFRFIFPKNLDDNFHILSVTFVGVVRQIVRNSIGKNNSKQQRPLFFI